MFAPFIYSKCIKLRSKGGNLYEITRCFLKQIDRQFSETGGLGGLNQFHHWVVTGSSSLMLLLLLKREGG